ncbi:type II toxin-antitoxin system RelE/ParE family toxin [Aliirhizobium smilacinae]|uniref:Type II toxin-antitoxin system RelE/ParE family toxin n=1 Tax=Aliirhizobium smilacinae TaxID=1395944 RepID=A0A5C4XT14_9HYPH|nr:type II toxin-antitoxin system RelE/ParE family toxin [Rhizobium smilacinae]TNM65720.1 type II toxin-antitoxin system RelE/ParE family toxin [Rhizobium smilacinae]
MEVVFTPQAYRELDRIWSYIEQDNPTRAITFVREIGQRCLRLKDMPFRYQLIPGHEDSRIRRLSFKNYAIFYHVIEDTVYILHILNAAQDHEKVLFPKDP